MNRNPVLLCSLLVSVATSTSYSASQRYEFVNSQLFGINFVTGDCYNPGLIPNACNGSLLLPLEGGFTLDIDDLSGTITLRDADNGGGGLDESFATAIDEHLPGILVDDSTYRFEHPRYDTAIQIEIVDDVANVSGAFRMSGYSVSFIGAPKFLTNDDGTITADLGIRRPSTAIAVPEPNLHLGVMLSAGLFILRRRRHHGLIPKRNRNAGPKLSRKKT